jgi:hypothetical protein
MTDVRLIEAESYRQAALIRDEAPDADIEAAPGTRPSIQRTIS